MTDIPISAHDLFWSKVQQGETDQCWLWMGHIGSGGYGRHKAKPFATTLAHRIAYLLAQGSIPFGLLVCHKCDNPACCNPAHLFIGTSRDNSQDALRKGRLRVPCGEEHACAKLSRMNVLEIQSLPELPAIVLAARFGVSRATIYAIRNKLRWRSVRDEEAE